MHHLTLVLLAATAAPAPSPPPPPRTDALACTRQTLLDERGCTVEGRSGPRPASREHAVLNVRAAAALADELCRVVARGDALDADPLVLAACRARIAPATRNCAGDGSRPLQDDAGRFNPGFARCYAGLAELVRAVAADADVAADCCVCATGCGVTEAQCLARWDDGELGTCVAERCRAECAESLLLQRARTFAATTRNP
ncbi:MAG: hypothetical protein A2138_05340 [Deltaproteobacteria bacterium RBG_16_71_12]|nr:MAG: hypothetical protein A2138_05340 [Deltaproteobacteria bacterium RBG_16_71_12]